MSKKNAIIDSHCHVQFPAYDVDRQVVIERAQKVGVGMMIIGTQYSTSVEAVGLAERYPDEAWAAVGFHPNHVNPDSYHDPWESREKQQEIFEYEKFRELACHFKVAAIGECGLDYYRIRNHESGIIERQKEVFRYQIELAKEVNKPLVVHCRNAFRDLIGILNFCFPISDSRPRGVVHFFSGSWEEAQKLFELGFYLSFGGVVTFSRDYDQAVKRSPLDRLLIETDAPYVSPLPYRGKRNEPAYIDEIVKKIAELRGILYDEVADATTMNARRLFSL